MMEAFSPHWEPMMLVDGALLALLLAVAVAVARVRDLFAVAILTGVYSLVSALFFVRLDAVDVAFTEAAVGAGVSTVLLLGAQLLVAKREIAPISKFRGRAALLVTLAAGAALAYGTIDMPAYGDPDSPANAYVGREYLERTEKDVGVPNVVTAVLASYRGFDTMGEVVVVFTAFVGVGLIFAGRTRRRPNRDGEASAAGGKGGA